MDLLNKIQGFIGRRSKKYENLAIFSIITVYIVFSIGSGLVKAADIIDVQNVYKQGTSESVSITKDSSPNAQTTQYTAVTSLLVLFSSTLGSPGLFTTDEAASRNGLLTFVNSQIVAMYQNQPGVNIPKYLAKQWVPGQQTSTSLYAATDGYTHLMDIGMDTLSEKTSIIANIMFVFVLIASGFMIMFRQKIGGQLAITIFNSIPNVIIGLILVAFNFAIIGLILNISVLATNVIAGVLGVGSTAIKIDNPLALFKLLTQPEYWNALGTFSGSTAFTNPIVNIVDLILKVVQTGLGGIVSLVILLISLVAILYVSIRVYFVLIQAYLAILIDVVLAPIVIAFGSIPGNEGMRDEVFKRVFKNALVFPGVFLFINLGSFILSNKVNIQFPYGLTTGDWANAGSSQDIIGSFLRMVISIGLFYMAAEVPTFLGDFIQLNGGKNAAEAIGNAKKSLSKIPLVGSLFN